MVSRSTSLLTGLEFQMDYKLSLIYVYIEKARAYTTRAAALNYRIRLRDEDDILRWFIELLIFLEIYGINFNPPTPIDISSYFEIYV